MAGTDLIQEYFYNLINVRKSIEVGGGRTGFAKSRLAGSGEGFALVNWATAA
jgi:hypothetical protein